MREFLYRPIYDFFGGNSFLISVFAGVFVSNCYFVFFNSFFFYLDIVRPKWAKHYRIQEEKEVSLEKYFAAFKLIFINAWIVSIGVTTFFYPIGIWRGMTYHPDDIPSLFVLVRDILISIVVEEFGFYYSHRLFHHPKIYKHYHKIHHEWVAPVSISSIYCHWIEHAVANLAPLILGPIVCGSHVTTLWIWIGIAIAFTTSSHSGYHFPLQPSPEAHDYHHKVFNECFGVLGWLDKLHNTDKSFRKTVNFKRSEFVFFTDPKIVYPAEEVAVAAN